MFLRSVVTTLRCALRPVVRAALVRGPSTGTKIRDCYGCTPALWILQLHAVDRILMQVANAHHSASPRANGGMCGCCTLGRPAGVCGVASCPGQLFAGVDRTRVAVHSATMRQGSIVVYGMVASGQIPPVALFTKAAWSSRARSGSTS